MLSFGGFLNSSFWSSYRSPASTSVEDILNSKDCSVEKLLEDDDCLQEFKNLNEKLIQYFDHDKMKKLIDLITVMPSEDTSLRGHKLPFVASEIFNCEINQILDKFFEQKEESDKDENPNQEEIKEEEEPNTVKEVVTLDEKSEKTEDLEEGDKNLQVDQQVEQQEVHEEEKTETIESKQEQDTVEVQEVVEKIENEIEKTVTEQVIQEQTTETKTSEEQNEQIEQIKSSQQEQVVNEKIEEVKETIQEQDTQIQQSEETGNNEQINKDLTEEKKESVEEMPKSSLVNFEPEDEESTIEKKNVIMSYVLLNRLFKFIRTDEKPLNAVLSGYFAKLVTLLINRKQKQIIPFVYAEGCDIIDRLVYHVYQKSIAELLNKLLTVVDNELDSSVVQEMKRKQEQSIQSLLMKLSPDCSEDDNYNGSCIIGDMLEIKESYQLICKKPNLSLLVEFIMNQNGTQTSRYYSAQVLTQIIQFYHEKHQNKGSSKKKGENDDDEEITLQNSDEETEIQSEEENSLVEVLKVNMNNLSELFQNSIPNEEMVNPMDSNKFIPLGQLRLKIVEMVMFILKLHKQELYQAIQETNILSRISELIIQYPWNNFLQLKVISIYEEILESPETQQNRKALLQCSKIGDIILELSKNTMYSHESKRTFRFGHMAAVIKLANLIQKHNDKTEVQEYITQFGEEWQSFIDGEFKTSNEVNNKSLGGQQPRTSINDDDDNGDHYEVDMNKIMGRFTNFNQMQSNQNEEDNNQNEENKKSDENQDMVDETNDNQKDDEEEEDRFKAFEKLQVSSGHRQNIHIRKHEDELVETNIQPQEQLKEEYCDHSFWKVDHLGQNLDELMSQMGL